MARADLPSGTGVVVSSQVLGPHQRPSWWERVKSFPRQRVVKLVAASLGDCVGNRFSVGCIG
ncbi:hypothetical protein [Promicromonospora aerolata]|uniref:Uncharacterized protein n=1 Tax=Promicromonospora aerolata TaxID=195749 RepID=A0ABW4VDZ0_9MICO